MYKAVIYARFSSAQQTEQTIENQIRICSDYANNNKMQVIRTYIDRKKSGRSDNRPEFQKMLQDITKGEFKYIIVYMLDRFMRNTYLALTTEHILEKNGVELISVCEPIQKDDTGVSDIVKFILSWNAEKFSKTLSRRMRDVHKDILLKGKWTGGHLPFGYKVENKKIIIDDEKADIIKFLFINYAKGINKKAIADEIFKRWQIKLNLNSMSCYINNKKYIGIVECNGEEYTNIYPPIIDKNLFLEAQQKMSIKKYKPALGNTKTEYLLQGKIFCAKCGSPMICDSGTSHIGKKYHYYTCSSKKKDKSCNKKTENREDIEKKVIEVTQDYVFDFQFLNEYADKLLEIYNQKYDNTYLIEIKKQYNSVDKKMTKLTNAFVDAERGSTLRTKIQTDIKEIEPLYLDLKNQVEMLEISQQNKITKERLIEMFMELSKKHNPKTLIDLFVSRVFVDDDSILVSYFLDGTECLNFEQIKKGSNLNLLGSSKSLKNEPLQALLINNVFCVKKFFKKFIKFT